MSSEPATPARRLETRVMPLFWRPRVQMPRCKHCDEEMDFYVPTRPPWDQEHPACAGKALAQKHAAEFERILKKHLKAA